MKILLLDNYDSFTYNLAHRLREITGEKISVVRNDCLDINTLQEFSHLVLSPGPGVPREAGRMMEILEVAKGKMPVLGVCLGHQALAESYGGDLLNLQCVVHGKEHLIRREGESPLFQGLPESFPASRYHSWVVNPETLPEELRVTAWGPEGEVMAIEHRELPLYGVQFHPESIMTKAGYTILQNWSKL